VNAAAIEARKAVAALEDAKNVHQTEIAALQHDTKGERMLNNRLEAENDRLSQEIEVQKQMKVKLQNDLTDREKELAQLRLQMQQREAIARESAHNEIREVQRQLEESRMEAQKRQVEWENQRKQIEESHSSELASVSVKVKALIEGKENTIQALKEQLLAAQTRLREIEQLFHQQKKSILAAKRQNQ
jgi:hypothetical protein